jgi:hypothetical protein
MKASKFSDPQKAFTPVHTDGIVPFYRPSLGMGLDEPKMSLKFTQSHYSKSDDTMIATLRFSD